MFDGGHLVYSRWPKVSSVRPLDNMKANFKFEVDWGNGSKDIAFTRVVHSIHFHKFDGSHLLFSKWPKVNNVRSLDNIKTKFEVDWGNGSKDIAFTKVVHSIHF